MNRIKKKASTTKKLYKLMRSIVTIAAILLFVLTGLRPLYYPLEITPNAAALPEVVQVIAKTPEVLPTDLILSRTAFVIPEYKLIFFTFPKVACSEWKRMFMRMNGIPEWCIIRGINAHSPKVNKIKTLQNYPIEIVSAIMTSPLWTKAAFVREPKERVLSAFLDKSVKEPWYFTKKCCEKIKNPKMSEKCTKGLKKFKSFLYFVSTYPKVCFDVHWEAQVEKIDAKWWPYIDFIGRQNNLVSDAKRLLETLTSTRDPVPNRSAWERYGATGWGASNDCENRTHGFLEENSSTHKLNTGSHLHEWYTTEDEILVEAVWAAEWSENRIDFPNINIHQH